MNKFKWHYITYGLIWVSVAVAISVGIYVTKSGSPLWAFLFPACINMSVKNTND